MGFGYVEGVTHDYKRHATTTLFAALDIQSGEVLAQCKRRHRDQEFLTFLNYLDASVPPDMDVHLIVDNYATHKHPRVKAWLARRPRYHVHFTPTYASWLNQVERWFGLITQQAIRRGSLNGRIPGHNGGKVHFHSLTLWRAHERKMPVSYQKMSVSY
jgi:putative transposase